jgi:hypothetical protein
VVRTPEFGQELTWVWSVQPGYGLSPRRCRPARPSRRRVPIRGTARNSAEQRGTARNSAEQRGTARNSAEQRGTARNSASSEEQVARFLFRLLKIATADVIGVVILVLCLISLRITHSNMGELIWSSS